MTPPRAIRATLVALCVAGMVAGAPACAADGDDIEAALKESAYAEASRSFIEEHAFCRSTFAYVAQCIGSQEQKAKLNDATKALRAEAIAAAETIAVREEGLYTKTGASWPEFDTERRRERTAAVGLSLACPTFLATKRQQVDRCRELVSKPGERFQAAFDDAKTRLSAANKSKQSQPAQIAVEEKPAENVAAGKPGDAAVAAQPADKIIDKPAEAAKAIAVLPSRQKAVSEADQVPAEVDAKRPPQRGLAATKATQPVGATAADSKKIKIAAKKKLKVASAKEGAKASVKKRKAAAKAE